MRIPGMRGLTVRRLAGRVLAEFLEDDMLTYAAAMAYHLLIAVFPFIVVLVALLGFLNLEGLFDWLLERSRRALPGEAQRLVAEVVADVRTQNSGGLLSVGIALSVWFASIGMRSAMNALNHAYDTTERRSRLRRYALSVAYTAAFALLVVAATVLMNVGPRVVEWAARLVGLGDAFVEVWRWARIPAALALAMLAVSLVYYFAPCLDQRFRLFTPGAVVAVLLWALVSALFQLYVANFGSYSVTYGSIGAVVVLLLYFFLSSAVLLLGGEINAEVEWERPRSDDPRPMAEGTAAIP